MEINRPSNTPKDFGSPFESSPAEAASSTPKTTKTGRPRGKTISTATTTIRKSRHPKGKPGPFSRYRPRAKSMSDAIQRTPSEGRLSLDESVEDIGFHTLGTTHSAPELTHSRSDQVHLPLGDTYINLESLLDQASALTKGKLQEEEIGACIQFLLCVDGRFTECDFCDQRVEALRTLLPKETQQEIQDLSSKMTDLRKKKKLLKKEGATKEILQHVKDLIKEAKVEIATKLNVSPSVIDTLLKGKLRKRLTDALSSMMKTPRTEYTVEGLTLFQEASTMTHSGKLIHGYTASSELVKRGDTNALRNGHVGNAYTNVDSDGNLMGIRLQKADDIATMTNQLQLMAAHAMESANKLGLVENKDGTFTFQATINTGLDLDRKKSLFMRVVKGKSEDERRSIMQMKKIIERLPTQGMAFIYKGKVVHLLPPILRIVPCSTTGTSNMERTRKFNLDASTQEMHQLLGSSTLERVIDQINIKGGTPEEFSVIEDLSELRENYETALSEAKTLKRRFKRSRAIKKAKRALLKGIQSLVEEHKDAISGNPHLKKLKIALDAVHYNLTGKTLGGKKLRKKTDSGKIFLANCVLQEVLNTCPSDGCKSANDRTLIEQGVRLAAKIYEKKNGATFDPFSSSFTPWKEEGRIFRNILIGVMKHIGHPVVGKVRGLDHKGTGKPELKWGAQGLAKTFLGKDLSLYRGELGVHWGKSDRSDSEVDFRYTMDPHHADDPYVLKINARIRALEEAERAF